MTEYRFLNLTRTQGTLAEPESLLLRVVTGGGTVRDVPLTLKDLVNIAASASGLVRLYFQEGKFAE